MKRARQNTYGNPGSRFWLNYYCLSQEFG